ncbi:MAG: ATP-binding protein [Christensenellaceae bacterium]|jgi:serine/threonine-protein kinase RsbT
MAKPLVLTYHVPGDDFSWAGEASGQVKNTLKQLGFPADVVRRVAISLYEGEINMVIHAGGGDITVEIFADHVTLCLQDKGPGIADVSLAMKAGFSTAPEHVRDLGFGAGMGLPNMEKYTDAIEVDSVVGEGTTVKMLVKNQTEA